MPLAARRSSAALAFFAISSSALPSLADQRIDAAPIRDAVANLAAEVQRLGGTVGAHVVDLESGDIIASLAEHRAFNPASNAKLVTAAASLKLLGSHHRFITGLYGKIEGDTVDELVLRGDGDPTLRTADLWALAAELRTAGVRHVRSISIDQSFFDDQYVPPAFDQQPNEWSAFRAPIAPVSLNGNTVVFTIRATREGSDAVVDVEPPGFVDLSGSIETSRKGDAEKAIVSLEPRGARLAARVGGKVPAGGRVVRVAKRVHDPRLLAGYALRFALKNVGVDVRGEPKLGGAKQTTPIVSHRSAALHEILPGLGKDSDNFQAEMLFKAASAKQLGRPGTAEASAQIVRAAMERLGAFEPGMIMKNGSGLFDADRFTPASTTTLLRSMFRDPAVGPEFLSQLSVGGVDGTLRHRFRDWADVHAVRAKTGTLDAVVALSGYVTGPKWKSSVAFSVYVNGVSGKVSVVRASIDRVVDATARELWRGTTPP